MTPPSHHRIVSKFNYYISILYIRPPIHGDVNLQGEDEWKEMASAQQHKTCISRTGPLFLHSVWKGATWTSLDNFQNTRSFLSMNGPKYDFSEVSEPRNLHDVMVSETGISFPRL